MISGDPGSIEMLGLLQGDMGMIRLRGIISQNTGLSHTERSAGSILSRLIFGKRVGVSC